MVYHGIGLKQSYYKDTNSRINIRAVESAARFDELKKDGHQNLLLTGYTKLDRLFTIPDKEIDSIKRSIQLDNSKKNTIICSKFLSILS